MLSLVDRWIYEATLERGSGEYEAVMDQLLLVCEHTRGMDTKKHLLDFTNWGKADFTSANQERHGLLVSGVRNRHILAVREELRTYRGESTTSSYEHFSRLHVEQRALYLTMQSRHFHPSIVRGSAKTADDVSRTLRGRDAIIHAD